MRTPIVLFAVALCGTACSSAPPPNPDGCPSLGAGTETVSGLSARPGNTCIASNNFDRDTWVITFDGHGQATLESALYANDPVLGSTGARSCTGAVVSANGIRCSSIAVDCPASMNKGFGNGLSVNAPLAAGAQPVVASETGLVNSGACTNLYDASATH